MRAEFVERKLQLITDDLMLLDPFGEISHDDLLANPIGLASVERLLERIVLRAVDVNLHIVRSALPVGNEPTTRLTYRDSFTALARIGVFPVDFATDVGRSAGLRNVLAHDYNDADRSLVHASIGLCLDQYPRYVQHVRTFLDEQANRDG